MRILITGGCGFIGCNAAQRFLQADHDVVILDDLSRAGSDRNLEWLRQQAGFEFIKDDICDPDVLAEVVRYGGFDVALHLAAQVAVTTSVTAPRRDFEINALGTFNLLEAVRRYSPDTIVLNASTNKVYGKLGDYALEEQAARYSLPQPPHGICESQPLDFHSPYGCSKGAADQYVSDYARIYGLRTVNFRQSCIYGYRQFGVEDQGWVAWFAIAHSHELPVTIYGNGKQVRDILFIDDLIDCYVAAIGKIDGVAGMTFNIGGGPENTLSLLELLDMLEQRSGRPVRHSFSECRPGDQPVYISDVRKAEKLLGWRPRVGVDEGVSKLHEWITSSEVSFVEFAGRV